jgi:hypothetical protein
MDVNQETGTLILFHPTDGVRSQQGLPFSEAEKIAREFSQEHYPTIDVWNIWVRGSWWLMEDDHHLFFGPRPWPIAGFFTDSGMIDTFQGCPAPKWLALVALDTSDFTFMGFEDAQDMRQKMSQMFGHYGAQVVDNPFGGLTVKLPQTLGEPITIAYGVQFTT